MISTANAEPKGSEPSSTDCTSTSPDSGLRCTKNHRLVHLEHVNGDVVWDDRDYEPECQHPDRRYAGALYDGPNNRKSFQYYACPDCMKHWKEEVSEEPRPCTCGPAGHCDSCDPEEPPLTPEEEEEFGECPGWPECPSPGSCPACSTPAEPPPPQPRRRPPYAVAYSVQGHLYEVALPGDATVRAVDGALVIQHHLGPVAAICQVLPVINEESNG